MWQLGMFQRDGGFCGRCPILETTGRKSAFWPRETSSWAQVPGCALQRIPPLSGHFGSHVRLHHQRAVIFRVAMLVGSFTVVFVFRIQMPLRRRGIQEKLLVPLHSGA